MITLSDFRVLPFDKKCDFITVFGDYLISHKKNGVKSYLYHMNDYYIEVNFDPKEGEVLKIHAFRNAVFTEKYLDQIGISDLQPQL